MHHPFDLNEYMKKEWKYSLKTNQFWLIEESLDDDENLSNSLNNILLNIPFFSS